MDGVMCRGNFTNTIIVVINQCSLWLRISVIFLSHFAKKNLMCAKCETINKSTLVNQFFICTDFTTLLFIFSVIRYFFSFSASTLLFLFIPFHWGASGDRELSTYSSLRNMIYFESMRMKIEIFLRFTLF